MTKRNLILIHRGPEYEADFDEIAVAVNAIDRGITVYHVPCNLPAELPANAWQHPTLTVALISNFLLPVRRGPILKNYPIHKLDQQATFRNHGIPTPPALPFRFGMKLDPILFGDFVILKPSDLKLTSFGEGIHVLRRERVEALVPANFPPAHPIRWSEGGFIVQRFVHTGTYPVNYRATTFLGEVMTLERYRGQVPTPPLSASDEEIEQANFAPKENRAWALVDHAHVISMARRTAAAFPQIPLLGVDIIESTAGELYVLEVNAGGNTWHYSSKMWEEHRKADPTYYADMRTQFGAFGIAARGLADATQRLAS